MSRALQLRKTSELVVTFEPTVCTHSARIPSGALKSYRRGH